MTKAAEQLLAEALTLTADERAELAAKLAESVEQPMSRSWTEEIRRRVEAYLAGKSAAVSARDALAWAADPRRRP